MEKVIQTITIYTKTQSTVCIKCSSLIKLKTVKALQLRIKVALFNSMDFNKINFILLILTMSVGSKSLIEPVMHRVLVVVTTKNQMEKVGCCFLMVCTFNVIECCTAHTRAVFECLW